MKLIGFTAFQLFFGKLYFLFHIKYVFLSTLFIFELGSLICAVAPNSIALILGVSYPGEISYLALTECSGLLLVWGLRAYSPDL